ncbi:MAG: putative teichuronic acid biosynthesis glycosyltransferase TuaC [candidate division WS2 bacterium ADurb.Bin280]|uniref:Putative teichuronic acid biosynthesis glycosyltransferase TuaC n=1 Tax=candidate division WS2 bacterium ADurb.Bin280 TaxID=1852829 RepID=A0A1V5SBD7_9BACT|nr:MAG: putative teichuronic acid biosynthesis glycosyltransferase TuaC [candidate division WS2 bacterium ADurb.Bin280]
MRILLVSPYFFPHRGGVEQFNLELSKYLAKSHDLTVLSSKFNSEKESEYFLGFKIVRIPHFNLLGGTLPVPKSNLIVKKIIDSSNFETIITSTRFFPINFLITFYANRRKLKHVHIEHGSGFATLRNRLLSLISKVYDLIIGRYVLRSADVVFGISKKSVDFAKSLGARRTDLFYNSVDCKFFDRTTNKKNHDRIIIAFIGRFIHAKGIHDLIEVFKTIEGENLVLKIVGAGNYEHKLKELSKADKRIKFIVEPSREQIRDLLCATDIFVNPSYNEGLPTSVLEAGASSCAAIATDVGGTSEIIEHNKSGLLIRPADRGKLCLYLKKLINDKALRLSFSKELNKTINNKFCFDHNAANFQSKIEKI